MKYLNALGLQKFCDFLNDNGILLMDLVDKNKELQEEFNNQDNQRIILRLLDLKRDNNESLLEGFIYKCFKSSINPNYVKSHIRVFEVDDFVISPILLDNETYSDRDKNIQGMYHEYMCERFKNTPYLDDYDRYVTNFTTNTKEKN